MKIERKYPFKLSSTRLRSVDVEVWAKLTGQNDNQAAQDLISMQFQGSEIEEAMTASTQLVKGHMQRTKTRRTAAENVFSTYLK